jgi:hypothetical protein
MTNSHKNIINPFLGSSTLLIMTFLEIVESKDLLWGRTCAVDNVRARRTGVLGKLYEIQISPERGLRNSLKFRWVLFFKDFAVFNVFLFLFNVFLKRYWQLVYFFLHFFLGFCFDVNCNI